MYDKIILISLDTLRSDCLISNTNPLWPSKYTTPHSVRRSLLDELITRSAYFPNCISAAPYTSASHASFFTGLWPLRHGVFEFFNRQLKADTLFTAGKRMGYKNLFKVDFPIILGPHLGFDRDIDHYMVEEDDNFLDALEHEDKTIAFAHFGGIHIPYGFHNLHFGKHHYRRRVTELESEIGLPFTPAGDQLVETYRDKEDLEYLHRYKCIVQHYYERGQYDKLFGLYLEGVDHFMQNRFESFLSRLLLIAEKSRSLVIIFADHGEEYDADSYGHHNSLNEGVLRVPLIIYAPDICPGVHNGRIRSIDMVPTVLDRIGQQKIIGDLDGESLAATVWHGAPYSERFCLAQAYTSDTAEFVAHQAQMLKTGRHAPDLRHVKYKEAVYLAGQKLVRQNYEYSEAGGIFGLRESLKPDRYYSQASQASDWQQVESLPDAKELYAKLDAYNSLHTIGQPITIQDEVRQSLQNSGYRI